MSNIYEQNIIDNYKNPVNYGKPNKFTHTAKFSNLSCGDDITVYLTIENYLVKEIMFEGSGCALSVATMSILTDHIKEMNINDVLKMEYKDLTDMIGVIPNPARSKCVLTGMEALRKALN